MPLPISRTMNWPDDIVPPEVIAFLQLVAAAQGVELPGTQAAQGGGNLNGSQNTANLLGQAGTAGSRLGVARANKGNYCGVV